MNSSDFAGQPVLEVRAGGVTYTLLGTAHVSVKSLEAVIAAIDSGTFDTIAVELDANRHRQLTEPEALYQLDIFQIIKQDKIGLVAANLSLAAYQRRLAAQLGIEPGAELKAASIEAAVRGLRLEPLAVLGLFQARPTGRRTRRRPAELGTGRRSRNRTAQTRRYAGIQLR